MQLSVSDAIGYPAYLSKSTKLYMYIVRFDTFVLMSAKGLILNLNWHSRSVPNKPHGSSKTSPFSFYKDCSLLYIVDFCMEITSKCVCSHKWRCLASIRFSSSPNSICVCVCVCVCACVCACLHIFCMCAHSRVCKASDILLSDRRRWPPSESRHPLYWCE